MSDRRIYRRKRKFTHNDPGTIAFALCVIVLVCSTLQIRSNEKSQQKYQELSVAFVGHPLAPQPVRNPQR
jgi:hypothetical protein